MGKVSEHPAYPYCVPLVAWLLLGLLELTHPHAVYAVYPVKTFVAGFLVFKYWFRLPPMRPTHVWGSVGVGLMVAVLWIGLDSTLVKRTPGEGFNPYPLFGPSETSHALIFFRVLGAVFVVPLIEEIFWRGFLMRYWISPQFTEVKLGTFTRLSFLGTTAFFAAAHGEEWALAVGAGLLFGAWFVRTKSLGDVIIAHSIANLALAIYVLSTVRWYFW